MTKLPPSELFTRRVCLQLDGMDAVTIRRDIAYGPIERGLLFDLYYPADERADDRWPAVIIVAGYPGTMEPRATTLTYKEVGWTVSMCHLIARSGIVAIAYANHRDPVADLEALFEHIHESAEPLRIDPRRIGLRPRFPRTATLLEAAAEDVLAYRLFPSEHQRQLHSTNVLERLNKEIKRRSNVVGIFPSPKSTLRLVGAILLEQDDEWAVADRRYFSAESMKQLTAPALSPTAQELLAAIG